MRLNNPYALGRMLELRPYNASHHQALSQDARMRSKNLQYIFRTIAVVEILTPAIFYFVKNTTDAVLVQERCDADCGE